MENFLTTEELSQLQRLNEEFNKIKIRISDIEIEKFMAINAIDKLRTEFAAHEKKFIDKYGADSIINLKTGEITKKQQ